MPPRTTTNALKRSTPSKPSHLTISHSNSLPSLLSNDISKKAPWRTRLAYTPTMKSLPSPRSHPVSFSDSARDKTPMYGWLLLVATGCYFVGAMYALCAPLFVREDQRGSKIYRMDIPVAMERNAYYALLIPLLGPVTVFFIFFNWFGLKFFRHNA
ncbi:hypothetical protein PhCBS80983_g04039 [Powellomyces hirtus]|uniref:Uncharacterized protein n=1 Tax=Powellomyces hirtus TaxID=109895 RepID=A0A507E247_9FUNG|nr:hypothetical protein PhCBS80983_g04039 [Powellomyces hirtus]